MSESLTPPIALVTGATSGLGYATAPGAGRAGALYAKGGLGSSSKRSRDPSVIDQVYALTEERLTALGI